ncbi:MAG: MoxR family ATPase [Lachnospiraceae bacterium]|nr:MoxR family ATPase [Lachnospiraceae bacterium]
MEQYDVRVAKMIREIRKVIVGKDDVIEKLLMVILAKGHVLIEDIPGVGKTTLALAVSKVMQMEYRRMQFTPDVLPSDVIGFSMYDREGNSQYRPGSIMCNLFLADEINRTSSKTQSALLEVMEESKVTVDGVTREVPMPFTVIATQNPIGSVGTQMLPESQMDRFMVRLSMGYPDLQSEITMMKERHMKNPLEEVEQVISREQLLQMQEEVEQVFIHDAVYTYIAKLVEKTREQELLALGISPRGTIALANMSKAAAYLSGRNYVIPDDVRAVFLDVTAHRMLLSPKARVNRVSIEDIVRDILNSVAAPRLVRQRV